MDKKKMSVKELAYRADIAQSTATNLYKGEMRRFDIPVLDKVARALGVSFADLFKEEAETGNSLPQRLAA